MFTTEQVKKYVETQGRACPHCNSTHTVGGRIILGDHEIIRQMHCKMCKKEYVETWVLSGVIESED